MELDIKQKRELGETSKKVVAILAIIFLLILPLNQVERQIEDRRGFEKIAQDEVAEGWGDKVLFTTPTVFAQDQHIIPSLSETEITIDSQEKKRGVFKVPVYLATLKTKIRYTRPALKIEASPIRRILPEYLHVHIDPIAAVQTYKVKDVKTGKELKSRLNEFGLKVFAEDVPDQHFFDKEIEVEITMRGTSAMNYESNSDKDTVKIAGNWRKPKFFDTIFPDETKLDSNGFSAKWNLNSLPTHSKGDRKIKSIGLNHLWISTDYTKIERAVKYGILFVVLTFLLVFAVEFMSHTKVHPLQYALIGLSISIFYLLLVAISEVLGFDVAYIISSVAVSALIVFYVNGFIKNQKFTMMILAEQIILNIFFYVLLALEERSFLLGTVGLFTALATFMIITRKIDWYSGSFKPQSDVKV